MNITKLSCWPSLQAAGFTPVRFRARGRVVATGAALQRHGKDIHGKPFATDVICIEPQCNGHSDGRNYHVTGEVKTPYQDTFYRYEGSRKVEFYDTVTRVNEFYKAGEVLAVIQKMII